MRNYPFFGLIRNKLLLIGMAISIMFALVSIILLIPNGVDNQTFNQGSETSPQALYDEVAFIPSRYVNQDDDYQPIDETSMELESTQAEEETSTEQFPAINEAFCVPDHTERKVGLVIKVLDTDRLSVLIDGQLSTVKYIGIDSHTTYQKVNEQSLSTNHSLVGKTVTLVKDVSDADEAGRLLRYVFTEDTFINLYLLENGLATAVNTPPDEACVKYFLEAQEIAKSQEIGTWERLNPEDWREWPVVPAISDNALQIYLHGLEEGRNPQSFSIVGDCQSIPGRLFRRFNWAEFSLPTEYAYLQPTRDHFRSVWSRSPVTVGKYYTVASMFAPFWNDTSRCGLMETPLDCEFRLNNPSIVLISIGSNQKPGNWEDFNNYMRKIVEYSIEHNVLPIIATKTDPTEEGFPLNHVMAQIAYDYDIPLWNFWDAAKELPNHGLDSDDQMGIHITSEAYGIKRITGLQVLHAVLTAAQR